MMKSKIIIILVLSVILLTVGVNLQLGNPPQDTPGQFDLVYGAGLWKCLKSVLRAAGAAAGAIAASSTGNPWIISSAWTSYGLSLEAVSKNCIFVK